MDTALQSSVYVSSPEFAGWLTKRGFHWRKLWKKRWVALHGAEIVYMDKEPTIENSSTMTITKAQITTATVIDREDLDGNANGFAIHINDGVTPTWYLRADSQREKKSWLMRLFHVHAIVKWLEDFEKVKVLGVGGTGIVYELLHKTNGTRFAMKEMEIKNKQQMQMAISEAEMLKDIMENVSHPNIMHIEKVFQVGSKFYLVFPLCTGGELYEHIIRRGHFNERDAAQIMKDLISALNALHAHEILHLDIKPENILFDSNRDDARIRLTDFGLSKVFSDSHLKAQQQKFSVQLMQERLRVFVETGELNREKLRGTIGYMAPELILTGHCCKATDVFAAGVVLFILLSGRPPFNSKSNREVLEKTARGLYSMTGAEWDEVSEDAKDLVVKMLMVNPDERISTEDILQHPFITQLDNININDSNDSLSESTNGSEVNVLINNNTINSDQSLSMSLTNRRTSNNVNTLSTRNLTNALRHLSGHVKQMRSEKLASNVTRLVSLLQQTGDNNNNSSSSKNTLSKLYLLPKANDSTTTNTNNNINVDEENDDSVYLNTDFREGLVAAFDQFSDVANNNNNNNANINNNGRIPIDIILNAIKQMNSLHNSNQNSSNSLGPLLVCQFIDRDKDGFITADDIFAAQAQVMQRSEMFLKLIFRVYTESLWYPGRQLNLMSLMQQTNSNNTTNNVGGNNVSSSHNSAKLSGNNVNNDNESGTRVLSSSQLTTTTVVEPPKFITSRHIGAVFDKMGYESNVSTKVFQILMEAIARVHRETNNNINDLSLSTGRIEEGFDEEDERESTLYSTPNSALVKALNDDDDDDVDSGSNANNNNSLFSPSRFSSRSNKNTNNNNNNNSNESPTKSEQQVRMSFQDFCKACELDDILIQAVCKRSRISLLNVMRKAETRLRATSVDELAQLSIQDNNNNTNNNDNQQQQQNRFSSVDVNNSDANYAMQQSIRRLSKGITASVIHEELFRKSDANNNMNNSYNTNNNSGNRLSESNSTRTFPIANAVRNAALGLATKMASSAQTLIAVANEALESEDNNNHNVNSNNNNQTFERDRDSDDDEQE